MDTGLRQEAEPEAVLTRSGATGRAEDLTQSDSQDLWPDLSATIATSVELQRRYRRYALGVPIGLSAAVAAAIIAGRLLTEPADFLPFLTQPSILLLIVFGLLFVPLCASLALSSVARRLATHTGELAESGETDSFGPLIDLLSVDQPEVRRTAARALTQRLASLKEEDVPVFTVPRRLQLIRRLRTNPDYLLYRDVGDLIRPPTAGQKWNREAIDFRVAILESYAHIGGSLELSTVRDLAESASSDEAQSRLRETATRVLPLVEARASRESEHKSLLRAAETSAEAGPLLQPAASGPSTDSTLLRASE